MTLGRGDRAELAAVLFMNERPCAETESLEPSGTTSIDTVTFRYTALHGTVHDTTTLALPEAFVVQGPTRRSCRAGSG